MGTADIGRLEDIAAIQAERSKSNSYMKNFFICEGGNYSFDATEVIVISCFLFHIGKLT